MTYLEAVNKVLLRLRENQVTTVQGTGNSNQYARLIGEFVNEAKAQVESAWNWSTLRSVVEITTSAGVYNYTLTGATNRSNVLAAYNDTSNFVMEYKDAAWFQEVFLLAQTQDGAPYNYTFNGVTTSDEQKVDVFPVPDGVYSLKFDLAIPNTSLSADSDVLYIPSRPVILLATAMAIEERGEDGGQQSLNAYVAAKNALADEIALDAARHPEETLWYSV